MNFLNENKTVVENIRKLCVENHTNFAELERKLGFSNATIRKWGESPRRPNHDRLCLVAENFNVSVEFLRGEKEKPVAQGDGLTSFDSAVLDFIHSLPRDQLRGILLALKAPQELLDALDREERPE